jgi:hypothetical protein
MNAPSLTDGRYLVVVRRGDPTLLFGLGHCLEYAQNVEIIQDRRLGDRRSGNGDAEQKRQVGERRQTLMGHALALVVRVPLAEGDF